MEYRLARCAPGSAGLLTIEWRRRHRDGWTKPYSDTIVLLRAEDPQPHPIFAQTFAAPLLELAADVPDEYLLQLASARIGVHPDQLSLAEAGSPKPEVREGAKRLTLVRLPEGGRIIFDAPMLPGAPPDADAVSRSARKLTQAVETFGINLPAGGLALDLGSSPGGWVQVLRRAGMRVMAVDPADLAPAVTADPGVMHRRVKVQKLDLPKEPLVMLTNDLRMVADSSVEAVLRIAPRLVKGAPCIMTLKLPEHGVRDSDVLTILEKALSRLETEFEILGARQLPVNRSEVTVAMRRPSS